MNQQAAASMQPAVEEPVQVSHRNLAYLQAVVEEKQIPLITSSQRDSTVESNIFMMQGMEHSDERSVILLSVPHARVDGDAPESTPPGEGYQIIRLID